MGIIKQYKPAFFSGWELKDNTIETLDELLKIDWVNNFKTTPRFYQFSVSRYPDQNILMAEYKNGREWYVVGFLEEAKSIIDELPEWKEPNN